MSLEYTNPITVKDLDDLINLDYLKYLSYGNWEPIEIVYQLMKTRSTKEKESILRSASVNAAFLEGVRLAYDHRVLFGQKKIPDHSPLNERAEPVMKTISRLEHIYSRQVTGNKAKDLLRQILQQSDRFGSLFIELVVTKDLRCGINKKLIQKAIPDLIPNHPVMLCHKMDTDRLENLPYPEVIAQIKMDGTRCTFTVSPEQEVRAYMRNGKVLEQVPEIIVKCLRDVPREVTKNANGVAIDGELLVRKDSSSNTFLPRKKGNGIINKCLKGTASDEELSRIVFCFWDVILLDSFWSGRSDIPLRQRMKALNKIADFVSQVEHRERSRGSFLDMMSVPDDSPFNRVMMVETHRPGSFQEVQRLFEQVVGDGQEGLVVKDLNGGWVDGRPAHQIKMKVEKTMELIVKDVYEGKGKYVGKLGGFVCVSEDGSIACEVGSGFSDEERDWFWKKPPIESKTTVKYNEVITAEGRETKSLYQPIYDEVREDL